MMTTAMVMMVMSTLERCMYFWSLSSARLLTMMWMVILIITTVAMLATLRFMSTPMLMLVTMRRIMLVITWESNEGLPDVLTLLGYIARVSRLMNELFECVEQCSRACTRQGLQEGVRVVGPSRSDAYLCVLLQVLAG